MKPRLRAEAMRDIAVRADLPGENLAASRVRLVFVSVLLVLFVLPSQPLRAEDPAHTPPMGWSEWDSYGLTVTETEFRANATVLAGLRRYGWQYALLDAGWYEDNPASTQPAARHYELDRNGRLIPASNRFPSAKDGKGFRALADWLHSRGLKLGIHVMLGIPRQAVEQDDLIAGSSLNASAAADTAQTCPWDREFYAVKDNAAGQAWYDSIAQQYADWGVDLIKLGCVTDRPFRASEIRQISEAIRRTGRSIILSLSPEPPPAAGVTFVRKYSQMWRVSPEHWDIWTTPANKSGFPIGLRDEFDLLAKWSPLVKPGNWIDPDALPDGWLGPRPAWGAPRSSRLTHDEERSQFTLWAFARAPLIEGTNLTRLDPFTRQLMTSRLLLHIDQDTLESHPIRDLSPEWSQIRAWEAHTMKSGVSQYFLALFNLSDTTVHLGGVRNALSSTGKKRISPCYENHQTGMPSSVAEIVLPAHGSAVYCLL